MQNNCFCYAVDLNYVFPAALSAMQLKHSTQSGVADVFIICFDDSKSISPDIIGTLDSLGIKFIHVPKSELNGLSLAYARLFVDKILPSQYENIVYIDADTQILGSLERMFSPDFLKSDFIAARDAMTLIVNSDTTIGRNTKKYFQSIGLKENYHENYFNSGVIKFRRNILENIRSNVRQILAENDNDFIHYDQDVLNIVLSENLDRMSVKWNFPAFLMGYSHYRASSTQILHFCSNPRPWHGPFIPWKDEFFDKYVEFAKHFPNISHKTQPLRGFKKAKYVLQMRYKSVFERFTWDSEYSKLKMSEQENNVLF